MVSWSMVFGEFECIDGHSLGMVSMGTPWPLPVLV